MKIGDRVRWVSNVGKYGDGPLGEWYGEVLSVSCGIPARFVSDADGALREDITIPRIPAAKVRRECPQHSYTVRWDGVDVDPIIALDNLTVVTAS